MSELSEKIPDRDNMNAAYRRVCAGNGTGGADDGTVGGSETTSGGTGQNQGAEQGEGIQTQASQGVEIPKANGGVRKPGIPTGMDRVIQQEIVPMISPMCEPLFPEYSYGFRSDRGSEVAVRQPLVNPNEE